MPDPQTPPIDPRDRHTILVHYYRAMVGRADIWRLRMDTTTNWAIGATAAVLSFGLGDPSTPHLVLSIAPLMTGAFLILEGRRLTFYRLWQERVLLLERALVRPAIAGPDAAGGVDLERDLAPLLGTTIPTMPLAKAIARRLRRVYLFLFAVQGLAWGLKLSIASAEPSVAGMVEAAQVGRVPGSAVVALVVVSLATATGVAFVLGGTGGVGDEPAAAVPEGSPSKGPGPATT